MRGGWQPAHACGAGVVIDEARVPVAIRRGGGKDFLHTQRLIPPLIGVGVEEAGRVHVPRWAVPVEREGERGPPGLRAQLFLPDIVRPAAARLAPRPDEPTSELQPLITTSCPSF